MHIHCKKTTKAVALYFRDTCICDKVCQYHRYVSHRYPNFVSLFLPGHLLVRVTWLFLASASGEARAGERDFGLISWSFTSCICCLLSHTLVKFSVFVVCRSVVFSACTGS